MFNKEKLVIVIFCILCLLMVMALIFGLTYSRFLGESKKQELDTKELIIYNYTQNKQLLKTECYSIDAEDNDTYLEIYAYMEENAYQYYVVYKRGDDIGYIFR